MAQKKGSGRKNKNVQPAAEAVEQVVEQAPVPETPATPVPAPEPAAFDASDDLQKKVAEMREAAGELLASADVDGMVGKAKQAVKDNPLATGVAAAGLVVGAPLVVIALGAAATTKGGRETARKYFDRAKNALDAAQQGAEAAAKPAEAAPEAGETVSEQQPDPVKEAKAAAKAALNDFMRKFKP